VENGSPFAQTAPNPEPIIARVRRHLRDEYAHGRRICPPAPDLNRAAADAVHALWDSRVRTFVEVLALRQARELLNATSSPLHEDPRGRLRAATSTAARPSIGFRREADDSLALSDDGLIA